MSKPLDLGVFENLELIPKLLEKIENLEKKIQLFAPDLTKRKGVLQFLDISDKTLSNMMNDGRFKEGIHYKRNNAKISYIESAIIDFKSSNDRGIQKDNLSALEALKR